MPSAREPFWDLVSLSFYTAGACRFSYGLYIGSIDDERDVFALLYYSCWSKKLLAPVTLISFIEICGLRLAKPFD